MHFFTSINQNYFAKACVLAKSIKQYCPNAKFSLILADSVPEGIQWEEKGIDEVITVDQLSIPVDNLKQWIFIHSVVELCTAIKGQALVKFLEEGSEKVVYLDPDIAVFDNLTELEALLDTHDVLLTPHQTIPETTDQDIMNNEICSLKHGVYNFGFFAVRNSENGLKFARWWRDRLLKFCYDDIPNGLFTDQRWGDLAPAMFDGVHILRDPGYNVSTWNITTRTVRKSDDGKYYVNGTPLKFYHFSGFDSGNQEIMLNLQGKGNPVLFELREWYIKRQNEEGQERWHSIPSIYNFYDNGERITNRERILMRNRLDVLNFFADTDPAKVEQEKSYYKWYRNEVGQPSDACDTNPEIVNLKSQLTSSEARLTEIQNSRSWRLAKKISAVSEFFRKH